MDQWEYRVAYVDSRGRISCEGVEFIRQSGEHRTTFVSRYLTALGREGWSLSGIQHLGRAETALRAAAPARRPCHTGRGDRAERGSGGHAGVATMECVQAIAAR